MFKKLIEEYTLKNFYQSQIILYEVINWPFFVKKTTNYVLHKSPRVLVYMYGEKFEEGFLMCTSITYTTKDHYFGRNF
ncbi:choloylglycine hydrolase, partial [Listeria monocytogenes]|nr:choloylglycine hydrolase [Listeria monocytogenes]